MTHEIQDLINSMGLQVDLTVRRTSRFEHVGSSLVLEVDDAEHVMTLTAPEGHREVFVGPTAESCGEQAMAFYAG